MSTAIAKLMSYTPLEHANEVINWCLQDPDIWLTHGCPTESKMEKIAQHIAMKIAEIQASYSRSHRIIVEIGGSGGGEDGK